MRETYRVNVCYIRNVRICVLAKAVNKFCTGWNNFVDLSSWHMKITVRWNRDISTGSAMRSSHSTALTAQDYFFCSGCRKNPPNFWANVAVWFLFVTYLFGCHQSDLRTWSNRERSLDGRVSTIWNHVTTWRSIGPGGAFMEVHHATMTNTETYSYIVDKKQAVEMF